jgi:hypothetical protein
MTRNVCGVLLPHGRVNPPVRQIVREARRLEALSMSIYVRLAGASATTATCTRFGCRWPAEAAHVGRRATRIDARRVGAEIQLPPSGMHVRPRHAIEP